MIWSPLPVVLRSSVEKSIPSHRYDVKDKEECLVAIRFLLYWMLSVTIGQGVASAQAPLDLRALIDEAVATNPSLDVLRNRMDSQRARIPQAGALVDPMLKFELSNVPLSDFDFASTPMSGKQLMLSQKLPYPGKRGIKERVAEHMTNEIEWAYQDRTGLIVNLVKQDYFNLAFIERSIEITKKNEQLLKDFVHIAEKKYEVGRGLQQDILKAQVTLSSLKDRLINLRRAQQKSKARLNTVLNRPPQTSIGKPSTLVPTFFSFEVDTLQTLTLANRPLLRGVQEKVQRWQAVERLAKLASRPDFDVSVGYRQRAFMPFDPVRGSDFLSVGVMLNLPIYQGSKQDQQVIEARARQREAVADYEAKKQQLYNEVQQLYIDVRAYQEEVVLFRTAIIPQAKQALDVAIVAYQVDKVDFLTLLSNQVALFNFEIDHFRYQIEYEKSLADLEAVVGKRLF